MGRSGSRRSVRVGHLLREELGQALGRDLGDPRLRFVSVTAVEVTDDLRHARVFVTMLGEESERESSLEALERATPLLRALLGRHLELRRIPELEFRYDTSLDRGFRIQRILQELAGDEDGDDR